MLFPLQVLYSQTPAAPHALPPSTHRRAQPVPAWPSPSGSALPRRVLSPASFCQRARSTSSSGPLFFQLPISVFHLLNFYSYLNATIGSTFVALLTGIMAAVTQIAANARMAEAIESGSVLSTPNNIALNKREAAIPAGTPTATPTASTIQASHVTIQMTLWRGAPSAMRIPISLVRAEML